MSEDKISLGPNMELKISRLKYTWAQPRDDESSDLPDLCMCGLSAWLGPKTLGLAIRQTHVCLGSALG